MSQDPDRSLFFTDGHVISRHAVVIPAQLHAFVNDDFSRVMFKFGDDWVCHDMDVMVRSVTFQASSQKCYLMGWNGIIGSCGMLGSPFSLASLEGTFEETTIPDVEEYGDLNRIRAVGEGVYVCGQSCQVYELQGSRWIHMDKGIIGQNSETLHDIDGTERNNIYAVGLSGSMYHFDGNLWTQLDSPTDQHLLNVRCVSRNEVYVCGYKGNIFRGSMNDWQFIGDPEFDGTCWGMDSFGGKLYLAHSRGLIMYDGNSLNAVDIGAGKDATFHRLHANKQMLYSFGPDDLFAYDGTRWSEIICPENE
jgi:hypothetical protein